MLCGRNALQRAFALGERHTNECMLLALLSAVPVHNSHSFAAAAPLPTFGTNDDAAESTLDVLDVLGVKNIEHALLIVVVVAQKVASL